MNIDEIKEPDNVSEENQSVATKISRKTSGKRKIAFSKIIISYAVVGIIIIAAILALKNIFFRQPNNIDFSAKSVHMKPTANNKSKPFNALPGKSALPEIAGAVQSADNSAADKYDNSAANRLVLEPEGIKKSKTTGAIEPYAVTGMPAPSQENIKDMLKYNAEINRLSEEAKIAQLKQQIKNLYIRGGNGSGAYGAYRNIAGTDISLVAATKNTAVIAFGKKNILMRAGMKYAGYECLAINQNGVALEKNDRVINLSLGM